MRMAVKPPPRPPSCVCTNQRERQVPDADLAHVRGGRTGLGEHNPDNIA